MSKGRKNVFRLLMNRSKFSDEMEFSDLETEGKFFIRKKNKSIN